jgi:uracil-DNA glycosylase
MPLHVDDSWQNIIEYSYAGLTCEYRKFLRDDKDYFPSYDNFLNAFKTLPLDKTKYILFGQDPYPREQSATGYAFIDGAVKTLFSEKGFSKEVNKATSLRNFLKMLLLGDGYLNNDNLTQDAISKLNKKGLINTIDELRINFEKNGILLLNAALIFTEKKSSLTHVKEFKVFMNRLLERLAHRRITLILFGNMAKEIRKNIPNALEYKTIETLHPYNLGFIDDSSVQNFFKPMNLLKL